MTKKHNKSAEEKSGEPSPRMKWRDYEKELGRLRVEPAELQEWIKLTVVPQTG
jgi:hypothetical protein